MNRFSFARGTFFFGVKWKYFSPFDFKEVYLPLMQVGPLLIRIIFFAAQKALSYLITLINSNDLGRPESEKAPQCLAFAFLWEYHMNHV